MLDSPLINCWKACPLMWRSLEPAECYCEWYVSVYPMALEELLNPVKLLALESCFSGTFFLVNWIPSLLVTLPPSSLPLPPLLKRDSHLKEDTTIFTPHSALWREMEVTYCALKNTWKSRQGRVASLYPTWGVDGTSTSWEVVQHFLS